MKAKRLWSPVVVLAVLAGAVSACGGAAGEQSDDGAAVDTVTEVLPRVKLETVRVREVEQRYDFTATVEANVTNNIAPAMSVRIDRIFVEVGDAVQRGQRLVQMDRSSAMQQRVQLENLQVEFERTDQLFKVGGASKSEWDARKAALDVARTAYDNLLTNTVLTSPVSGVVTARNYDNADVYAMGAPVVVVEQITPVKLRINVSERFFTAVKKGQAVRLTLDVYGTEEFTGNVSLIYPTIDPATRTFGVEITVPNRDRRVRPGMFARVQMSFGTRNHVVVPDRAVVKQPGSGERFIYVYRDGVVNYNSVELGQRLGGEYEIISGVQDGDQAVVTGQNRLIDGARVELDTTPLF